MKRNDESDVEVTSSSFELRSLDLAAVVDVLIGTLYLEFQI